MQLSCQEDRGVQWQYWRMLGKMPRLLLSQVRSQRVIPLQGARAGREKGGCQREGGAKLPRPAPLAWSPCGKKPLADAPASVLQARPRPPPALLLTTKPCAMGATGAGGGDWERKKGRREKGRPWEGTKSLWENISVDTLPGRITRQKHQHVLLSVRWLVTFVWDGVM